MSARIGVIGCGWWATRAHLPALVANPDAVDRRHRRPRRREPRARGGALRRAGRPRLRRRGDDARARPSSTRRSSPCPTTSMRRSRAPCLDRGLHLLLEKPMTIDPRGRARPRRARRGARRRAHHRLPVALQPPGRSPSATRIADGPDRDDRVRLLPVRLDRARALPRQPGALSRRARLFGQPARRSGPTPTPRSPVAARARRRSPTAPRCCSCSRA